MTNNWKIFVLKILVTFCPNFPIFSCPEAPVNLIFNTLFFGRLNSFGLIWIVFSVQKLGSKTFFWEKGVCQNYSSLWYGKG